MQIKDYMGSILASRTEWKGRGVFQTGVQKVRHTAVAIKAINNDEANGILMRMAFIAYPKADGWIGHHVVCQELTFFRPEDIVSVKPVD